MKKTGEVSVESDPVISSTPMRFAWDEKWDRENRHWFTEDPRPGSNPINVWYKADTGQVEFFVWEYDSVWLPADLLESNSQSKLVEALFEATRHSGISLHFNKGLAGATSSVIEEARLLERKNIRHSTIPDLFSSGGDRVVGVHDMQQPIFWMGSIDM